MDTKNKRYIMMKSLMDIGMGIIYLGVGIVILLAKKFGLVNEFLESSIAKVFAGVVIIYGAWRVYRGIRKDYFIDR
jgi:NhaP-type Na+/H+ or K+/H+ antiporter